MKSTKALSFSSSVRKFFGHFPDLQFDGTLIRCLVCDVHLASLRSYNCQRHVLSARHLANKKRQIQYWQFVYDLIFVFDACDIPQVMFDEKSFRLFWQKYFSHWKLPTRKELMYHLRRMKTITENNIKSVVRDKNVWITVIETTATGNKKICNIVVRVLKPGGVSSPYLLASRKLHQITAEEVQQLIRETLTKFSINKLQVLLLVTDGVTYMNKAGKLLKTKFPNLLHTNCLLHALNLVAETIQNSYTDIDKLISSTKKIFANSAKRIKEFHKACPDIPEPPQPVSRRWETWLEAAFYYRKHYKQIKTFILKLNTNESKLVKDSQELFKNVQIEADLCSLNENYAMLVDAIYKLQASVSLEESLAVIYNVEEMLKQLDDGPGILAAEKFSNILQENPDFVTLHSISLTNSAIQADLNRCCTYGFHMSMMVIHLMVSAVEEIPDWHNSKDAQELIDGITYKLGNQKFYNKRLRGVVLDFVKNGYLDFEGI